MHGVTININLPTYGNFTPEELTRKVRLFALELVSQQENPVATPPCCYSDEELETLLNQRMQSIENGTAELISHNEVKARIKAMLS